MSQGLSELGRFSPSAARAALEHLRDAGGGTLTVTSGLRDVRLVVDGGTGRVDALGYALEGHEPADLIRELLCALFWEDPSFVVEPSVAPSPPAGADSISAEAEPGALIDELTQGCDELADLLAKVPGLDSIVAVQGDPPPAELDEPSANLFRALEPHPRGGFLLLAAQQSDLDPIDAAWAVLDLLEAGQATVKPPPLAAVLRRLKAAEGTVDDGFTRSLRYAHLARGFARGDVARAARYHRLAGQAYLAAGFPHHALANFRAGLALNQEDVTLREGTVQALDAASQPNEARRVRQELIKLYLDWGLAARARAHMEVVGMSSAEERALLLECMLRMRDFEAAADLAAKLAPGMAPTERTALADRFARAGATGRPLDRAISASRLRRLRPLRRALWLLAFVALLGAAALGAEAWLRTRYRVAAAATRAALAEHDFAAARDAWSELRRVRSRIPPWARLEQWPLTCLGDVPEVLTRIDDLESDRRRYLASRDVLAWRDAGDTLAARAALEELAAAGAEGGPLAALARERIAELDAYRDEVAGKVELLAGKILAGGSGYQQALDLAHVLDREHADARDLWADASIRLVVETTPLEAALHIDGQEIPPAGEGHFYVDLPLGAEEPATLLVTAPDHVAQTAEVVYSESLRSVRLGFDLFAVNQIPLASGPPPGDRPGLHVFEDDGLRREVARKIGDGKPVRIDPSADVLAPIAERLTARERVSVRIHTSVDVGVFLESLEVYLQDLRTPPGEQPAPWRVDLSLIRRPHEEVDGVHVLADLSCVPNHPALVAAVRELVERMREDLPR